MSSTKQRRSSRGGERISRSWARSLGIALGIVIVATVASALINPLLGRVVHWEIMAVLMPALFALFAVLLRKGWV